MATCAHRFVVALATVVLVGGVAVGGSSASEADLSVDPMSISVSPLPHLDPPSAVRPAGRYGRDTAPQTLAEEPPLSARCLRDGGSGRVTVTRIAGSDRYETAVCISWFGFANHDDPNAPDGFKARAVVLARGDAFPDALAGGPLAAHAYGPLLLTKPDQLPISVQHEIARILAPGRTIYLLGGGSAISREIEQELEWSGYRIRRLAGANRFETSLKIANELPDTSNFFFTTGRDFPDALSAGNAAAALTFAAARDQAPATRPFALLLTDHDKMPAATRAFVLDRGEQFEQWTLATVGGPADRAAVSAFGAGSLATRLAGTNRFDTAAQVAEAVFTDAAGQLPGFGVGLATGQNFPDALGAAALLALHPDPLLLTTQSHLPTPTQQFLERRAGQGTYSYLAIFGGTSTISDAVMADAVTAFTP